MAPKLIPSNSSNVVNGLKKIARSLTKYAKPPWRVTGPVSSPNFVTPVFEASEFRKHIPGNITNSKKLEVCIPNSEPDLVYNIQYFDRDTRRTPTHHVTRSIDPVTLAREMKASDYATKIKSFSLGIQVPYESNPGDGFQR